MLKQALLLSAALGLLAACDSGGSNQTAQPTDQPAGTMPADGTAAGTAAPQMTAGGSFKVTGPAIRVVGSSTVYPFTTAVAENFRRRFPDAQTPIIESTGTGGGIKLFCGGVGRQYADIVNASRRIKPSEVEACRANGVNQIIEVQVGIDGIVLAQARNAPAVSLTPKDVYLALAATAPNGKPNAAKTWKDVNPQLPANRIEVLGPPPTSGTRDAFNELIMEKGCEQVPEVAALKAKNEDLFKERCTKVREDGAYVEAGENDNLIVQRLANNPGALGIFGYSYLEENADKVMGVALGGVQPTYESIASYQYPASRPLFIYVKGEHVRAKPALRAFLAEYTADRAFGDKGYLRQRGLVPAPAEVRQQNAQAAANLTPLDPASVK